MFKTELHCHMNFSGCSNVSAAELVEKYVAAGYSTVVITNHFNDWYIRREGGFSTLVENYFAAVEEVRAAAGDRLNILLGMELSLRCMPNDFLLYGLTREAVEQMEPLLDCRPWQVRDFMHGIGGIMIEAHPFRYGMTVVNPDEVDGLEVFNGHPGQNSHNEVAKHWALYWAEHHRRDGSYILTSGTDHHDSWHTPVGGIETEDEITSMDGLLAVLKSGNYNRLTASLGEKDY